MVGLRVGDKHRKMEKEKKEREERKKETPDRYTAMDHIDSVLVNAIVTGTDQKKVKLLISIKAVLSIGKLERTLNRYYDKTDLSEVYRIAMGKYIFLI